MKTHLLFIVLLWVSTQNVFSQRIYFTDTTNYWRCRASGGPTDCPYSVVNNFRYQGDSLIAGVTYQRLVGTDQVIYEEPNPTCNHNYKRAGTYFIREDTVAGKVWVRKRGDTSEVLAYNHNWAVGDTAFVVPFFGAMQITNIDSVQINNVRHRVFIIQRVPLGNNSYKTSIIQGLGCVEEPSFPCSRACYFECRTHLSCFFHQNVQPQFMPPVTASFSPNLPFSNTGPCNLGINTTGASQIVASLYPNPILATSKIVLTRKLSSGKLLIYNCGGKKVADIVIKNAFTIPLPVTISSPGLYFFQIRDNEGSSSSGKFIVE